MRTIFNGYSIIIFLYKILFNSEFSIQKYYNKAIQKQIRKLSMWIMQAE